MKALAHFLWWLGPWADSAAIPPGVDRRSLRIPTAAGGMDAHWYTPRGPMRGTWMISPGLTFLGIDDPRLDRFARMLAASGLGVFAPSIDDFRNMTVTPESIVEFQRAFDFLWDLPERPPGRPAVWSVSTGSVTALRLAAHPDYAERLSGLVTWGGYGAWRETVRFCLTGHDGVRQVTPRDRGHQPVTYINLLEHIEGAPADRGPLLAAWRAYVRKTWYAKLGHEALDAVAVEMQGEVPESQRALFLQGCGVGGAPSMDPALVALDGKSEAFAHLDAVDYLGDIRCPVVVIHAADDTVVPANQRFVIADGIHPDVPLQVHLTGLYGHSAAGSLHLLKVRTALNELTTLFRVAWAAAHLPSEG